MNNNNNNKKIITTETLGVSILAALMIVAITAAATAQQQSQQQLLAYAQQQLKGEVTNSKYLEITSHKGTPDLITGIVKNKTPEEISTPDIFALLYNKNNELIAVEYGALNPVASLPPNQMGDFEIKLYAGLYPEEIDHYVVIPSGTP